MDQLIDLAGALAKFLPAVIIFLFFLLGSFLKNSAKGQSQNRMPEFGGSPVFKPAARQAKPQLQRVPGSDPSAAASIPEMTDARTPGTKTENQPVYRESVKRSFEGDFGEYDNRGTTQAAPLGPRTIGATSPFRELGNSSASRAAAPAQSLFDQDDALKGLVWAEILGPPKARKFQRK